tara:strand:+ start:34 stop:444 length:411 start_codon:yes stop_codon:yes gene_type:complete
MSTFEKKVLISIKSAILFLLVNLPNTFKLTSKLLKLNLYNKYCVTNLGLIIHTLVFFSLTYLSMSKSKINKLIKLKHSIYGTLIYYLLSSPAIYYISYLLFGNIVSNINGCYTINGLLIHSVLYCLSLIGIMYLPN